MNKRFLAGVKPYVIFCVLAGGVFLLILSACAESPPTEGGRGSTVIFPTPSESSPSPLPESTAEFQAAPSQKPAPTESSPATVSENDQLEGPLSVVILSPEDGAEVNTSVVELVGEANPETVISIDDQIILVGDDGKFRLFLQLAEGPNVIEITASDLEENQGTVYLTVFYEP